MQKEDIIKVYLALFDRLPEKDGIESWFILANNNNLSLDILASKMIDVAVNLVNSSNDYREIYPQYYNFDIKNEDSIKNLIESVYKTLFNKDYASDPEGIDGWVNCALKTGDIGGTISSLINVADNFVRLEKIGVIKDDKIKKAVQSYENKLTVSEEFAEKINKADVNNDGVYDLQIFKDLIDEVTYTQKSVKTAEETIGELVQIEKYFQNHPSKVEKVSAIETFEINGHKLPLVTLSEDGFDFEAVVDDIQTIIPLVMVGDKIEPVSNPYIKEDDPTDDIPADDGNDTSTIIDNSTVVDLVDF